MPDTTSLPTQPQKPGLAASSYSKQFQCLWRDRILLSAFIVVALLCGGQITLIALHPPWYTQANERLLTILAWLGFFGVLLAARWASQKHSPVALTWWFWSAAMFFYASG